MKGMDFGFNGFDINSHYFLPILIKEKAYNTFLTYKEGSIEYVFRENNNLTAATAFSRKFHLIFSRSLFVVLFETKKNKF